MTASSRLSIVALALSTLLGTACRGTRTVADPVLVVHGAEGSELGVSTEYGVVFLGRSGRTGNAELTIWYGDGPSTEQVIIEAVGGGLYTAPTEIRLPSIPLTFHTPQPGERVEVRGRQGDDRWTAKLEVLSDPRVEGILLQPHERLRGRADQVGAGVYVYRDGERYLTGLVSGRILLETRTGNVEYLTVLGPTELWRLAAHRRDHDRRQPWVYREDVL